MKPSPESTPREPAPLSARSCEAVCVGFAAWTLCCHAVVLLGGTLDQVLALYALVLTVGAVGAWQQAKRGAPRAAGAPAEATSASRAPRSRPLRVVRFVGIAIGLTATVTISLTGSSIVMWWFAACSLLVAGIAFLLLEPPHPEAPRRGVTLEAGLFGIGLLCAAYALVAHRPDADDSFYINMAVGALDRPDLPLLAVDTLHGRDDLPIHFSSYRLHSLELAAAALARLTGIAPIQALHYAVAAGAALLVPLCHAVLFRLLTPRTWLFSVAALVFVLVSAGETHRWYGNFAFVRMWQGKGVFLFVFMPLVYAYAVRFALAPSWRDGVLLGAAQIAAIGCSSSAVWVAPTGAFMAMCSVLRPSWRDLRRFGLGALASVYVLVIGLALKRDMVAHAPTLKRRYEEGEQLSDAFARALGEGDLQIVGIAAFLTAWACCTRGLGQRFAIAIPLAVTVVLLNPYADAWVRANVTGPSYWRALWALPIPLLLALVLTAPLQWNGVRWRRAAGRVAAVTLAAVFAITVPAYPGWSPQNGVELALPHLKVDAAAYRWAAKLNQLAPGQTVVAPTGVSTWIPTFRDHAFPLVVRNYLRVNRARVGEVAFHERLVMTRYVGGDVIDPQAPAIFERGLETWNVKAVCLRNSDQAGTARQILRRTGFRRAVQGLGVEIWVRT